MSPWKILPAWLNPGAYPSLYPLRLYYLLALLPPEPEPGDLEFYGQFVRPTDVIVEIGAKWGAGTRLLSSLASHVFTFEPNPLYFRIIKLATRKLNNVTAFNFGIGSSQEIVVLQGDQIRAGSENKKSRERIARAKLLPLDEIALSPRPTAIVMDCEGYELEALKGAEKLLNSKQLRLLLIETHTDEYGASTFKETVSRVERQGFAATERRDSSGLTWVLAER